MGSEQGADMSSRELEFTLCGLCLDGHISRLYGCHRM